MRWARLILFCFLFFGLARCGTVPKIIFLKDPLSSQEHIQLGLSYEAQGKWDLAISEYQTALKKGGAASVIQGYLGNVYYAKKDYFTAKAAYRKSIEENPQNGPILNNLAAVYLAERENLKEAESLVQQAMEVDPSRRGYYLDTLGSIYMERGEYDLALSTYQEAEALAPPETSFLNQLRENKRRVLNLLESENRIDGEDRLERTD